MQTNLTELLRIQETDNWELDYLSNGSPIFQCKNLYTFSSDAVRLARAVEVESGERIVDLCAGGGIVGLEIAEEVSCRGEGAVSIDFVEIQEKVFALLEQNLKINKSSKNLRGFLTSVQEFSLCAENKQKYDKVVCNPPFFKIGAGKVSGDETIAISRHEIKLTLDELFDAVSRVIKQGGMFYMIHITMRDNEIMKLAQKKGFELVSREDLSGKLARSIYQFKFCSVR